MIAYVTRLKTCRRKFQENPAQWSPSTSPRQSWLTNLTWTEGIRSFEAQVPRHLVSLVWNCSLIWGFRSLYLTVELLGPVVCSRRLAARGSERDWTWRLGGYRPDKIYFGVICLRSPPQNLFSAWIQVMGPVVFCVVFCDFCKYIWVAPAFFSRSITNTQFDDHHSVSV